MRSELTKIEEELELRTEGGSRISNIQMFHSMDKLESIPTEQTDIEKNSMEETILKLLEINPSLAYAMIQKTILK